MEKGYSDYIRLSTVWQKCDRGKVWCVNVQGRVCLFRDKKDSRLPLKGILDQISKQSEQRSYLDRKCAAHWNTKEVVGFI